MLLPQTTCFSSFAFHPLLFFSSSSSYLLGCIHVLVLTLYFVPASCLHLLRSLLIFLHIHRMLFLLHPALGTLSLLFLISLVSSALLLFLDPPLHFSSLFCFIFCSSILIFIIFMSLISVKLNIFLPMPSFVLFVDPPSSSPLHLLFLALHLNILFFPNPPPRLEHFLKYRGNRNCV